MRPLIDEDGTRNPYNYDYGFLVVSLDSSGDLRVEGFDTEQDAREWLAENEYKCGLITAKCSMQEPCSLHWEDHT